MNRETFDSTLYWLLTLKPPIKALGLLLVTALFGSFCVLSLFVLANLLPRA